MQTVWKGSISFGLVSIPVRLVSATQEKDVSFRQVHAADGGRIRYQRVCERGHEVAYADIAKGYELPDGDMVILDEDDLADLPVASSRVVDVLTFVPLSDIDPTALSRAYYAEPTGDPKPYVLLREALEEANRVAVVKVALRTRERLAVLRPRDGVLVVQTMLWPDEVRRADFGFLDEDISVRPQEMQMAESYIETLTGEFDPGEYVDEYRQALLDVIDAKVQGREIVHAPEVPAEEGKVVDLVEALRRSVESARRQRGEPGTPPAGAGKRTAKSPAKRSAKESAKRTSSTPAADQPTAKKPAKKSGTRKPAAGSTGKSTAKKAAAKKPAKKAG